MSAKSRLHWVNHERSLAGLPVVDRSNVDSADEDGALSDAERRGFERCLIMLETLDPDSLIGFAYATAIRAKVERGAG